MQLPPLDPPPKRPPEEEPPPVEPEEDPPLEDPPEHAPFAQLAPTCAQSKHTVPPRPQAVSTALVLQLPSTSQQPLHAPQVPTPEVDPGPEEPVDASAAEESSPSGAVDELSEPYDLGALESSEPPPTDEPPDKGPPPSTSPEPPKPLPLPPHAAPTKALNAKQDAIGNTSRRARVLSLMVRSPWRLSDASGL
jgi:hypothetical protein